MHPARRIFVMTGASSVAGTLGRRTPPAVVTMPLTSTRSLTATTVPSPCSSETEMKALSSARSRIRARASSSRIAPFSVLDWGQVGGPITQALPASGDRGDNPPGRSAILPADVKPLLKPLRRLHRGEPFLEQGGRAYRLRAVDGRDPGSGRPPAGDDQRPRAALPHAQRQRRAPPAGSGPAQRRARGLVQ